MRVTPRSWRFFRRFSDLSRFRDEWLKRNQRLPICDVAETLKDYGLQRIQYSGFMGDLRRDELNSLLVDLKNLIKDMVENVQLFPVCDSCFKGRK